MTDVNALLRRRYLLDWLAESPAMTSNDRLAAEALTARGLVTSVDQAAAELAWLAETGLAATEQIAGYMVATLTQRGRDAADGRAKLPGIARWQPRG